jgi:hypothetical protein
MKINIKNLLFQPLALHLAADGEGLHLSARECKEILAEHVSEEIERAAVRGVVSLIGEVAGKIERAPSDDGAASVPQSTELVGKLQVRPRKGTAR